MIGSLDHIVLTTRDLDACIAFYTEVLGMTLERFSTGRLALRFAEQKINLHEYGQEFEPKAATPTPGSLDLCFLLQQSLDEVVAVLQARGVKIEQGPVLRTGARFPIRSVYIRDPDGNLIELAERATEIN
jgi:catechol 2,3-dioxygenase-like lactoylglutathione lyase family enzyme